MTRLLFRSCIFLFLVCCCLSSRHACGESFAVYQIGGDNGYNLIGIDAAGNAMIEAPTGCFGANDPNRCFQLFTNGQLVWQSDTLTGFTSDNGSACGYTSSTSVFLVGKSVCNGDNQVVGVRDNNAAQIREFALGSGDLADLVLGGTADIVYLNSSGEFLVSDGLDEKIFQIVNVTPEPAAFVLLTTATLAILWLGRRRFTRLSQRG